jgi:hypothetical protein
MRRRDAVPVLAIIAVLALVVMCFVQPAPPDDDYSGPDGSATTTGPAGLAAFTELLRQTGHGVSSTRAPFDRISLDSDTTIFIIGGASLNTAEVAALREYVERGGRLVVSQEGRLARLLLDLPPTWRSSRPGEGRPVAPVPTVAGINRVTATGIGAWRDTGEALPVLAGSEILAAVAIVGNGQVVLLAQYDMLENENLAAADNARFGLNLAAGRDAVFAEHLIHGSAVGLGALSWRWKLAGALLVVALVIWLAAVSRRFGPPEEKERPLPPPRRDYVDALAAGLARTRRPAEVVRPLRQRALQILERTEDLGTAPGERAIMGAATYFGLSEAEISALTGDPKTPAEATTAGRAALRVLARRWETP